MESLRVKGDDYVADMPRRRILTTLFNFDVAVMVFALAALVLNRGEGFSVRHLLFALGGWISIGNSNWYIFDILVCYLLTYAVYKTGLPEKCRVWGLAVVIFVAVVVLYFVKGPQTWWYDTLLAYPLGALFSHYREVVEKALKRRYWIWLILSVASVVCYKFVSHDLFGIKLNISTVAFAVGALLVLMKLRIHNSALEWLGAHLFPLYIYQRLPMIVLMFLLGDAVVQSHPYVYIGLSLAATLTIAAFYRFWEIKLR